MSTPRSLELPAGVHQVHTRGLAGEIVTLQVHATGERRGHVLLIPGWTGSKEDFTPLLPLLAGAGYDATAYDQRGQYESDPAGDYSLEAFAQDAHLLIEQAQSFSHVLGHSFGGLVAQRVARLHSENIASLSLLCTGPGALGDSAARPLSSLVHAIDVMSLEEVRATLPADPSLPPEIAAFLGKRFTSNAVASLRAMTQLLIDAPDIIDEVAATGLPCWVGRGADDDAWPHDVQAAMAKRLDTEVHVIAEAAHSPAVENPQGLIDAWLPFLHEHSQEAS